MNMAWLGHNFIQEYSIRLTQPVIQLQRKVSYFKVTKELLILEMKFSECKTSFGPLNSGRHTPTSSPPLSVLRPDQKRWAQMLTARHWSGFFRSLEAARAHWVRRGSWFSSLKHRVRSNVPMIRVIAAS